jgi:hypothetical protein
MPAQLQSDRIEDLRGRLRRLRESTEEYRRIVPPGDHDRRPPEGGWSIAQVFEHLCLADDSYLNAMESVIQSARPAPAEPGAGWRPSFIGGLMVRSFRSPRKMLVKAPRIYRPGPVPRPNVIDAYLERNRRTLDLLEGAAGLRWQKLRLVSPVTPLVRMNLGDGFEIIVTHAERHFRQIERIRQTV